MKLEKSYYESPRWSTEILDCSMPMSFDTYSNCAHQCVYCFAYFQRAVGGSADAYLAHKVKSVNVQKVKKLFLEPEKYYGGQFAWYIKARHVLQWGGMSDGFDWYERKFRKSLELLRFFREIDYPLSISTKGVWWIDDPEYREVVTGWKNLHWKYSIITTDEEDCKKVEAGVVSPYKRFEALKRIKEEFGNYTTTCFRPYMIGISDKTVEDMFRMSHWANVDSLTTEFLCIEKRASNTAAERYRIMSEYCGFDVYEFYVKNSRMQGLMRLNYDVKRPYIAQMEELAAQYNVPFFVSDAHHKEKSASCGCCGLPTQQGSDLSNAFTGHFAEAILIAKRNGKVFWSDIAEQAEPLKNIPYDRAQGYNTGSSGKRAKGMYWTMFDFMKNQWNNIMSWQSPARYFGGVLVPNGVDENKNIIYVYNEKFVNTGEHIRSVVGLGLVDQEQGEDHGGVELPMLKSEASSE